MGKIRVESVPHGWCDVEKKNGRDGVTIYLFKLCCYFQFSCNRNEWMNFEQVFPLLELHRSWIFPVRYVGSLSGADSIFQNFHSPPFILQRKVKLRSTDVKGMQQEDPISTWFYLYEIFTKLKRANSCLFKKSISPLLWVSMSSNITTFVCLSVLYVISCIIYSDHPYFTRSIGPVDSFPDQSSGKGKVVMEDNNEEISLTNVMVT